MPRTPFGLNPAHRELSRRRSARRAALALLLAAPVAAGVAAAVADDTGAAIDRARSAVDRWVDVRRAISRERADWRLRRETLDDRIALVQGEIDRFRAQIEEVTARADENEDNRIALDLENEQLKTAAAELVAEVVAMETRLRTLLPRLPDPIREKVAPLSQRMPVDGAETRMSIGERYQNVVGILNEINRANGEVFARSEIRELSDGTSAEVTTVYFGIGAAFYVSATGSFAAVGGPSADGWTWRPAPEAAEAVAGLVAILRNERPAAFIRLPFSTD